MAITRRQAIWGLAATSVVASGGVLAAISSSDDFEPFEPKNDADAIASTYRNSKTGWFDITSRSYQMNSDYLEGLTNRYEAPRLAKVTIAEYNPHNFEVRGAHIEKDGKSFPVIALYEDGERVGTAIPYKSNLRPSQIYAAVETPKPHAPGKPTTQQTALDLK